MARIKTRPRQWIQSVEAVKRALLENRGRAATVARLHGVSESAVSTFIARHPELQAAREQGRRAYDDEIVTEAETALIRNIKNGKEKSIMFALRHLARDRFGDETKNVPPLQLLINVLSPDEMSGLRSALAARLENPPPKIPAPEPNDK